jgi:hypothetical protein
MMIFRMWNKGVAKVIYAPEHDKGTYFVSAVIAGVLIAVVGALSH